MSSEEGVLLGLLEEARRGEDDAHGELIRTLRPLLVEGLERRLGDSSAARVIEDAVQDACVKILRCLGSCRASSDAEFIRWAGSVAMRCALDQIRSDPLRDAVPLSPAVTHPPGWDDPSGVNASLLRLLAEARESQSPAARRLLHARLVLGMTWREVGAALGTSASAAKRRYQRLLKPLRQDVQDRIAGLPDDEGHAIMARLGIVP